MKLISWNVNGLRACVQKGFLDYMKAAECGHFLYPGKQTSGGADPAGYAGV